MTLNNQDFESKGSQKAQNRYERAKDHNSIVSRNVEQDKKDYSHFVSECSLIDEEEDNKLFTSTHKPVMNNLPKDTLQKRKDIIFQSITESESVKDNLMDKPKVYYQPYHDESEGKL